jgi:hypothetical protein
MIKRIIRTADIPTIVIRVAAGLIFLSDGLQKCITPQATVARRLSQKIYKA